MVQGLCSLGVPVPNRDTTPELPAGVPLLVHVNAPQLPAFLLRLPRHLIRNRLVIGHWAWELPVPPPSWQAGLAFVHEVWACSRFTANALEVLIDGATHLKHRPVLRVVPYPVASAPPRPSALGRRDFGWPDGAVVVVVCFSLASSFERKNPLGAILAFRRAFGDRMDRLLVMKLSHVTHYPADMARLRAAIAGAPNIRLDDRTLPRADAHALLAAADIVLSLHRSEGFGLVPAEAMLLGRPVIATNWSGNTDFMTGESAALVGFRLIPAQDPRGVFEAPGAVWAEPDAREAVAQLVRLADDVEVRRQLGAGGRIMATARLGTAPLQAALGAIGFPAIGLAA
jgi:glycosyltransferase involved in cell wall biosynthesis